MCGRVGLNWGCWGCGGWLEVVGLPGAGGAVSCVGRWVTGVGEGVGGLGGSRGGAGGGVPRTVGISNGVRDVSRLGGVSGVLF